MERVSRGAERTLVIVAPQATVHIGYQQTIIGTNGVAQVRQILSGTFLAVWPSVLHLALANLGLRIVPSTHQAVFIAHLVTYNYAK